MQGNEFDWLKFFVDFVLHIDKHLAELVRNYQSWTYAILFIIVFCETGLVVTPFLPGDSLLFAAGSIAALGTGNQAGSALDPNLLFVIFVSAALLGDNVNYWIGHFIGNRVLSSNNRFFKKEYVDKTHRFYEKHGGKTVIIARFVPIIRTFAPFVAGVGAMRYSKFITYCVIGAVLWVGIFVYAGYFFGTLPFIQRNFSLVVVVIILISVVPIIIEILKSKLKKV